jgi:hypothetical protein
MKIKFFSVDEIDFKVLLAIRKANESENERNF